MKQQMHNNIHNTHNDDYGVLLMKQVHYNCIHNQEDHELHESSTIGTWASQTSSFTTTTHSNHESCQSNHLVLQTIPSTAIKKQEQTVPGITSISLSSSDNYDNYDNHDDENESCLSFTSILPYHDGNHDEDHHRDHQLDDNNVYILKTKNIEYNNHAIETLHNIKNTSITSNKYTQDQSASIIMIRAPIDLHVPKPLRSIMKKTNYKYKNKLSTAHRNDDHHQGGCRKHIHFDCVYVRKYAMELGDNPSCSYGPPVQLSWDRIDDHDFVIDLDLFEIERIPCRRQKQRHYCLNYYQRHDILINAGYTETDLIKATKNVINIQRQRSNTRLLLPLFILIETTIIHWKRRKEKQAFLQRIEHEIRIQ